MLALPLARLGGKDVVSTLIRTLETESRRPNLSHTELWHLESILCGLGFLAADSKVAFSYLSNHMAPASWRHTIPWNPPPGETDRSVVLAGFSMHALGLSRRSEVRNLLEDFMRRNPEQLDAMDGSIVTAHYYLDAAKKYGVWPFLDSIRDDDTLKLYSRWTRTEEGKKWHGWFKRRNLQR